MCYINFVIPVKVPFKKMYTHQNCKSRTSWHHKSCHSSSSANENVDDIICMIYYFVTSPHKQLVTYLQGTTESCADVGSAYWAVM